MHLSAYKKYFRASANWKGTDLRWAEKSMVQIAVAKTKV